jgi:hypothetical protein
MTIAQRMNYKNHLIFQKNSFNLKSINVFALRCLLRIRSHLSSKSGVLHRKKQNSNSKGIKTEKVLA